MLNNSINFNSGLNIYTVPSYSATATAYKGAKIVTICFDKMISEFWAHFHCACAETPILLLVKNLISPFASATQIFCDKGITLLSVYMFPVIWRFL